MLRLPRRPAIWIALGAAVAVALRLPWLTTPLSRDEGGVAYVAEAWHHAGAFAYGPYFLDRPPLLVALYGLANGIAGAPGIRILAALAAVVAVASSTAVAVRLGGRRA